MSGRWSSLSLARLPALLDARSLEQRGAICSSVPLHQPIDLPMGAVSVLQVPLDPLDTHSEGQGRQGAFVKKFFPPSGGVSCAHFTLQRVDYNS